MTTAKSWVSPIASWFAGLVSLSLAACQTATPIPASAPVIAPKLVVGDHWQYKITDNLRRGAITMLDAEVVSIANGVATLREVYEGPNGRSELAEEINANGWLVVGALKEELTRRFPTPLEMYDFPLEQAKSWRQTVDTTSPDTQLPAQILTYGTVQGMRPVTAPSGTFDAVYIYRILQLDDEQFWRTRTERRDSVWYVAQVKGPARELRDAQFTMYSGGVGSVVRSENTTRELTSFKPGGG
jgi:hypothetical protein